MRVNQRIRAREVRVIGPDGSQVGVMRTGEALKLAQEQGMDLVEIAPNANPPVCKVVEFGKYKYEQDKKDREARKHQHAGRLKEIKLRLNIDNHDFETKLKRMKEFLGEGMKVKVSLFFRGREQAHTELGYELMKRVLKDIEGSGQVEAPPRAAGRNLNMIVGPVRGGQKPKPQPTAPAGHAEAVA